VNDFQRRIGVGQPSRAFRLVGGPGTTKRRAVKAEEGARAGRTVGATTEHGSGRVDATATPDPIHYRRTNHE
jgi:hypothetical protein